MDVRISFTIAVLNEASVKNLIELSAQDSKSGARAFVKQEAEEMIIEYLTNNGVDSRVSISDGLHYVYED